MRYPPEHKQQTRARILRAAARRIRRAGVAGTGVAAVMKDADLSHGGFYTHFESKDALVEAVVREGFRETVEGYAAQFDHLPPAERLEAWVRGYLSPEHRDHPEAGCPFPALATEVTRAGEGTRSAFTDLLAERVEILCDALGDLPQEEAQRRVLAATSQMSGALAMARAVNEPLSRRILDAAADAAVRTLLSAEPRP